MERTLTESEDNKKEVFRETERIDENCAISSIGKILEMSKCRQVSQGS